MQRKKKSNSKVNRKLHKKRNNLFMNLQRFTINDLHARYFCGVAFQIG